MQAEPLILTLRLDPRSQGFFDELRERYFPPVRNFLKAHLTLFHQLPHFTFGQHPAFELQVTGVMHLGDGVAYRIESEQLTQLHRKLSKEYEAHLIPQDRQGFRPHITVQKKVTPEQARALLAFLNNTFEPFTVQAVGLDVWAYLGGPWRHEAFYSFLTNS